MHITIAHYALVFLSLPDFLVVWQLLIGVVNLFRLRNVLVEGLRAKDMVEAFLDVRQLSEGRFRIVNS